MKNLFLTILAFILMATGTISAQAIMNSQGLEITPIGMPTTHTVGENFSEFGTYVTINRGIINIEKDEISFRNVGNANIDQLQNLALYVAGQQVSAQTLINGEKILFMLDNGVTGGYIIPVADTVIFEIRADLISASINDSLQFEFLQAVSQVILPSGLSTEIWDFTTGELALHLLDPGFIEVSLDPSNPQNQIFEPETSSVTVLVTRTEVDLQGQVDDFTLRIEQGTEIYDENGNLTNDISYLQNYFENVHFYHDGVLMGTSQFAGTDIANAYVSFPGIVQLAGVNLQQFILDIGNATNGSRIKLSLECLDLGNPEWITGEAVPMNHLLGIAVGTFVEVYQQPISQLTITRTDDIPDGTTIVAGIQNHLGLKIMHYNTTNEVVTDTSVTIKLVGTGNVFPGNNIDINISVNGTQQGSARTFDYDVITINDISMEIQPGDSIEYEFYFHTIANNAPGTLKLEVVGFFSKLEDNTPIETFYGDFQLSESNSVEGAIFNLITSGNISCGNGEFIPGRDIYENTTGNSIHCPIFFAHGDSMGVKDLYYENLRGPEVGTRGIFELYSFEGNLLATSQMNGISLHFELSTQNMIRVLDENANGAFVKFNAFDITSPEQSGHQIELNLVAIEAVTMSTMADVPDENISITTSQSKVFTVLMDPETGMAPISGESEIKIFPTPTGSILNISSDEEVDKITIKNSNGQVILSQEYSQKINVSIFSPGMYFVQLHMPSNKIISKKFMKQ
jgi:hypothetical protein